VEQKQDIGYQIHLNFNSDKELVRHLNHSEVVSQAEYRKVLQTNLAGKQERALTYQLMQVVCSHDNIRRAHKQVKQNKGVAGVDQMPVSDFAKWYTNEGENLLSQLLSGTYQPQAVKLVEIPKPSGGIRKLGIPTVTDRIIQQAIAQVLSPIYERKFSDHSYGFRPNRNAQQALMKASEYVEEGRTIVVDMDLKTFFDVVNHDRLMYRLSETISDKVLLKLIRKYLQSGIMIDGVISQRIEGTPQGSPLSPLLSNIVLDELDTELESRGHKFV
jgi:RNA-directed DNA polymerase